MKINAFAMIAGFALSTLTLAQKKKIQRGDLPPAVEKTVVSIAD